MDHWNCSNASEHSRSSMTSVFVITKIVLGFETVKVSFELSKFIVLMSGVVKEIRSDGLCWFRAGQHHCRSRMLSGWLMIDAKREHLLDRLYQLFEHLSFQLIYIILNLAKIAICHCLGKHDSSLASSTREKLLKKRRFLYCLWTLCTGSVNAFL